VTLSLTERIVELATTWGPYGREAGVAALLTEWLGPQYTIKQDGLGGLLATRPGKPGGKKVLIAAHMDSLGVVVLNVTEKGFAQVAPLGELAVHNAIGQTLLFGSGAMGILQHEPVEDVKELDWKKAFVDLGVSSKADALQQVKLGDVGVIDGPVYERGAGLLTGPNLDNRAACALLVHVAQSLDDSPNEVTFAFTAQGKVNSRGTTPATWHAQPDLAIVLGLTNSSDVPRGAKTEVKLGAGPALRLKDGGWVIRAELADAIRAKAENLGLPLQVEVLSGVQSEAGAVANAIQGVPTAMLTLPARYRGTATETVAIADLEVAAKLVLQLAADVAIS
jgi:putative aminopeptidase FrvX